ncbi:MAG: hypothetical protein M3419_04630, partial [Actinomycetota bacterium]|nr:hypothetical protein [Actinomycetota bacterium]
MAPTKDIAGAARLPGTSTRRIAVGYGAAAILALLLTVIAVPAALLVLVDNPLPTSTPSMSWLQQPLTGATIAQICAVAGWLVWLHLVVCLVTEVVSERGRGGLARPVPGGATGTQPLARWIVNGLSGLRPAPSAPRPRSARAPPQAAAQPAPAPGHQPVPNRRHHVTPSTSSAREAVTAPTGAPVKYYEVSPPAGRNFETLWDISERFLGTGLRHREILELNRGVVQADGRTLSSLDLVQAGWMLRLPHDAEGPGLRASAPIDPVADDTAPAAATVDGHLGGRTPTVFGVEGGSLAAAAVDALRRSRTGGSLSWRATANAEDTVRAEHRLRREADPATARLLEHVLRGYGATLTSAPDGAPGAPALLRVLADAQTVTLTFDAAHGLTPRSPWNLGAAGQTWSIRRADLQRLTPEGPALHPALVVLGRTGRGAALAWDLESASGVISLGGDDTMARGVALSWAVDAALHAWADQRDVTLVGFAEVPTAVAPRALHRVTDIAPLLERLEGQADAQRRACRRHGVTSVRAGRLVEPGSPDWTARLVLLSGVPAPDVVARLDALAARADASVCVVVVGNVAQAALRLVVSPDGRLWNGPLGIDVRSQRLSVSAAQTLTSLFEAAREPVDVDVAGLDLRDVVPELSVPERVLDPQSHHEVEIGVLGGVAVDAHGPIQVGRRDLLTELVVYIALHPDGITHEELTEAVWPDGVDDGERRSALQEAGAWLGRSSDGADRLAVSPDRLSVRRGDVRLDWDAFVALLNRTGQRDVDEVATLTAAVGLVRGTPWSDLPPGRYAWLAHHDTDTVATIVVVLAARRLAALCARRDDGKGARDALRAGLRVAPAAEDLWRDALRLAGSFGGRRDVEAVAEEMTRSMSVHGRAPRVSEQTERLLRELLGRR